MAIAKRRIEYFYTMVKDRPGEAYRLLSELSESGVNLLAFNTIPMGPNHTQVVLFPEDITSLAEAAEESSLALTGPEHAFLIQGDDRLGALAEVHRALADAGVNVFTSGGVTDGRGGFGYLVYVRPEEYEQAAAALGI
ncbi:MAG: hypothetical protein ACC742_01680 [Thermoanaerobaculales bacterium]